MVEDLALAALLAGLELDLAAEHVDRGLEVDRPGRPPRPRPATVARCSAAAAIVSAPAIANRARDARALVDRAGLAQRPGEAGQDLDEVVRHVGDEVRLLPDHRDLVLELGRVVGADLGAEAVLERGDDPAAVGVVLGVGAGDHEHVERQPQHVAADLDVALLHHVEHRDLDPLGEVGQLVDRDDAAVAARDQAEVDGLGVAERSGPRRPSSGRRRRSGRRRWCRGWRASRRTARRGAATSTGRSSPSSAARRRLGVRDRLVGVLAELGARRSPASTRRAGPTRVRSSRVLPWPRSPSSTTSWPAISARSSCGMTVSSKPCRPGHGSRPSRERGEQVVADLVAQRLLLVPGGAELADGGDRGS